MRRFVVVVALLAIVVAALVLALPGERSKVQAAGSWSCRTGSYASSQQTYATCTFPVIAGTQGVFRAEQLCSTPSGNYWQYGGMVAGSGNVSVTPYCSGGYVIARTYYSNRVAKW